MPHTTNPTATHPINENSALISNEETGAAFIAFRGTDGTFHLEDAATSQIFDTDASTLEAAIREAELELLA